MPAHSDLLSDQMAMWIIGGLLSIVWALGQALALSKLAQLKDSLVAHAAEELTRDAANATRVSDALHSLTTHVHDLAAKVAQFSEAHAKLTEWRLSVDRRIERLEKSISELELDLRRRREDALG